MNQMRMMDAEGGRVVHRPRRAGGRLAVVVAVQNVLVVICLLVTVYVYLDRQKIASKDIVHIQFEPIAVLVPFQNTTLSFSHVGSKNLIDWTGDKIQIKCTGPYILHMDVCYKSVNKDKEAQGTLQLRVNGTNTPNSSVTLQATTELVCRGLQSIVYLRAKESATLHLYPINGFRMKKAKVGLSYLLGNRCDH